MVKLSVCCLLDLWAALESKDFAITGSEGYKVNLLLRKHLESFFWQTRLLKICLCGNSPHHIMEGVREVVRTISRVRLVVYYGQGVQVGTGGILSPRLPGDEMEVETGGIQTPQVYTIDIEVEAESGGARTSQVPRDDTGVVAETEVTALSLK